jgi:subfamily B ATP-binding cassette protein MsbA
MTATSPLTDTRATMNSKTLYGRLLRYVLPHWRMFALSIVGTIIVAATEPALAALLKPMLDGGFVAKDPTLIWLVPVLLMVVALARGIGGFTSAYAISWVANRLVMDLRDAMFRKLVSLPTHYYDNSSSGNLIATIAFNVSQVTDAGTNAVTVSVRDSVTIVGLLGYMLYLNWKLTLITLIIAPGIVYIVRQFSRRLRQTSREIQRCMGHLTHVLEEAIEGHKVVKIFGGQRYESQRFYDAINRARHFNMKQKAASAGNESLIFFIVSIALAVIVYIAFIQSAAHETTVGGFVAFITAMLMLSSPLKRLTSVNEQLQRGLAAAEVVFDLIDQPSEPDSGSEKLTKVRGEVRYEHVDFDYGDAIRPALNDIHFTITPGETIALVGSSGSGKTTLVNLLPRFYAPTGGRILVDGHDIRDIPLEALRANIALVSQDVVLFNDTVAANIAYGLRADASETDIIAAAEAAHAMEFIRDMSAGLATLVGENGVRLSGGQRQRLAIARAILKDAPILILDEATSSLDSQSERHVQAALETLMQNRTTIVIAHRLSTIEKADRILVMQQGRIVETGTHAELLAHNGAYATLYKLQFASPQRSVNL